MDRKDRTIGLYVGPTTHYAVRKGFGNRKSIELRERADGGAQLYLNDKGLAHMRTLLSKWESQLTNDRDALDRDLQANTPATAAAPYRAHKLHKGMGRITTAIASYDAAQEELEDAS